MIKLNITHSVLSIYLQEIRFDRRMPVREVKEQLEFKVGTPPDNQKLNLMDASGVLVCEMSNGHEDL